MNSGELFTYIKTQMEANPLLENAADSGISRDFSYEDTIANIDEDQDAAINDVPLREPTLKEHLLLRLDTVCPDKTSYRIGEFLIDNTDDNGYLKVDTGEVAYCLEVPEELAKEVLKKLQGLALPGSAQGI
jgi:DNA-directed RNA polymerase specialized sigma54-like protein